MQIWVARSIYWSHLITVYGQHFRLYIYIYICNVFLNIWLLTHLKVSIFHNSVFTSFSKRFMFHIDLGVQVTCTWYWTKSIVSVTPLTILCSCYYFVIIKHYTFEAIKCVLLRSVLFVVFSPLLNCLTKSWKPIKGSLILYKNLFFLLIVAQWRHMATEIRVNIGSGYG